MTTEVEELPEENIVTIGDLVLRRQQRYAARPGGCAHRHLEMDPVGEIVLCLDCARQVTPYWALTYLVEYFEKARDDIRQQRQQAAWERAQNVRTIAAKRIESTWRQGMAPTCPHCDAGILPSDNFGGSAVSKELEMQRRAKSEVQP